MNTALLFSGQATQYVGMGRHLYTHYPVCKSVFENADDILGERLSQLIFEGPEGRSTLQPTQPALLTVAVAAWACSRNMGFSRRWLLGTHSVNMRHSLRVARSVLMMR